MVTKLLESVGYRPNKLFPTHYYEDLDLASSDYVPAIYYLQETGIMGSYKGGYFYPHEHLTVEQGLSVARQLYKLYASSPYSYLHKTQKRLLISSRFYYTIMGLILYFCIFVTPPM